MDKQLKDEESTIAQLEEQLKTHKDSVKERKLKMAVVKNDLDAAVAELNEARQKVHEEEYPDEEGEHQQGDAAAADMAQPVPGPSPPTPKAKANKGDAAGMQGKAGKSDAPSSKDQLLQLRTGCTVCASMSGGAGVEEA